MRRNLLLIAAICLSLIASACGGGAANVDATGDLPEIEIEPTREFLLASAERTVALPYDFEMSISMLMDMGFVRLELSGDDPMITGSFDGERMSMHADLGILFDEMAESDDMVAAAFAERDAFRDDLYLDAVIDGTTMYLHAPMFGVPGMGTDMMDLSAVADGWGSVDLTRATGLGIDDLTSMTGAAGADPTTVLELLDMVGIEVRHDGSETVNGVETTRLVAPVTMADLMANQGDISDMAAGFGADPSMAGMEEMFVDATVDIVVNVDDRGFVRRVAFDMDFGDAFDSLLDDQAGALLGGELEMRMGMTMDFSNYGHTDRVEVPANVTDLTATFLNIASLGT